MSRQHKQGLDYFPHDCHFDDQLEYLIALHKEMGYYTYFRLLEKIYNGYGYYMEADKKNLVLFSNRINVDILALNGIINDCLSEHLFDKKRHTDYNILTSNGIQVRFFEAIRRRKTIELVKDFIIKTDNVNNLLQNVSIIYLNVDKSTQSKVKKSKGKESKLPFNSDSFKSAWNKWEQHRSEIRHGLTPTQTEKQFKKLSGYSEQDAIKVINQSIENGWQGLFELKDNGERKNPLRK